MANIVLATPGAQRQGAVNNRVERAENQSAFQAAEGLAKLSEAVGALERRRQGLKASADAAQMQADLSVWLKEQEATGNVDNLGKRFIEQKDKLLDGYSEKNGSMYYREALDEAGVSVFAGLIGQAENTEINGRFRQQQNDLERQIAAQNTVVMNDPSSWEKEADKAEATINAAVLPAETKALMIKNARHDFAIGALNGAMNIDPDVVVKAVKTSDFERDLSLAERQRYLAGAATSRGRVETDPVVYADLSERAQDGEDIRADARAALINGRITIENYNGLRSLFEKEKGSNRSYLMKNLKSESWFKTPDLEMAELDAQREAEAWYRQQKDVSLFDLDNKITELRYKYNLFQNTSTVTLPEKKRKEIVKLYYNAGDGSSYSKPSYEGLRQTTQSVFMRSDLTEENKTQIFKALEIELNNLQNKGTVK